MKFIITIVTILCTLTVCAQKTQPNDSTRFIYIDDTENYVNFPGGDDSLVAYLVDHIIYPDSSRIEGIEGIVYVQFSVDTSGKIYEVKIIKGLSPDIDKNVERVVSNMPTWEWTIKKRKKCTKTLPIKFSLN